MIPKEAKKLTLIRGTYQGKKAKFNAYDSGSVINVPFNPDKYSVTKTNAFAETNIPGLGSPIIQFTNGNSKTLTLELLLDSYAFDGGADIRKKYISKLQKLIEVDGELHAPPPCKVIWGSLEFVGVLHDLKKNYLLFSSEGTPIRARVNLSFKEYIPVEVQVKQTPFSSPDRLKKHLVKDGDSFWQLSSKHYGESHHWRIIADANQKVVLNPLNLETGTEIVIPPLPDSSSFGITPLVGGVT